MEKETAITDSDDRNGQTCTMCCAGYYKETSIHDDWDGVLHCSNKKCNHEVKRYKWKDNPPPKLKKPWLTPTAQSVLDAFTEDNSLHDWKHNHYNTEALAAALRAAADEIAPMVYEDIWTDGKILQYEKQDPVRDKLLAIAAELEGSL